MCDKLGLAIRKFCKQAIVHTETTSNVSGGQVAGVATVVTTGGPGGGPVIGMINPGVPAKGKGTGTGYVT